MKDMVYVIQIHSQQPGRVPKSNPWSVATLAMTSRHNATSEMINCHYIQWLIDCLSQFFLCSGDYTFETICSTLLLRFLGHHFKIRFVMWNCNANSMCTACECGKHGERRYSSQYVQQLIGCKFRIGGEQRRCSPGVIVSRQQCKAAPKQERCQS